MPNGKLMTAEPPKRPIVSIDWLDVQDIAVDMASKLFAEGGQGAIISKVHLQVQSHHQNLQQGSKLPNHKVNYSLLCCACPFFPEKAKVKHTEYERKETSCHKKQRNRNSKQETEKQKQVSVSRGMFLCFLFLFPQETEVWTRLKNEKIRVEIVFI